MSTPTPATAGTARRRLGLDVPESIVLMILAATLGAIVVLAAPPGTDFAAHDYQSAVFARHGFALWDNHWYAGRYAFVTYSLLYYPLAGFLGTSVVAIASVALSTCAFATVAGQEWGSPARWAARTFAVVWPAFLLTAAYPFTLGALFALLTFRALQRGRAGIACALCALTLAASPLAFTLLALTLAGVALGNRERAREMHWPALALFALGGLEVLLARMFPTDGRNPFPTADMLGVVAFCVVIVMLTGGDGRVRTLRWIFVVYGVATIGSYLVPSAVGAGVARFQFVALPLALLALSLRSRGARRRVLPLLAVILAAWINVPALASSFVNGARTDASTVAYWQPAIAFLRAHRSPSYRVEVVDTIGHWPAVYLARAGVPLARGWFRQDDFPQNAVLYGALDAGSYATWLQILGVRYVVLSDTTPDYSAQREARLLRSGRSGLTLVHRAPQLSIYEVRSPTPIIVGPHRARVLSLTQDGIAVALAGPGTYRLAVRYTPYWRPSTGCVSRAADGMTFLTVRQGGRARILFAWSPGRALDAVVGQAASSCATGRRPARGR